MKNLNEIKKTIGGLPVAQMQSVKGGANYSQLLATVQTILEKPEVQAAIADIKTAIANVADDKRRQRPGGGVSTQ